ncbi:PREDICTED: N-acetyltransferase 9 isoform X11 [Colobus angolensis palliatus]|uniref:N-acetyltransferase 9 isoform X11 n=1 Tax=Colobus angolensis palliatus TaxID=336983 RepID=UPI0005F3DBF1|nr:PREDICTED: N-acetyltransferase 9 isoform X11 [Colobus angolensis palliatus]
MAEVGGARSHAHVGGAAAGRAWERGWLEEVDHPFCSGRFRRWWAATMRLNQNTMLLGKKVVLVPYTSEHVPRYHEWMKSEELQRLTASEPLTLEQEYAMQRSWREDADKCTFIVLDAEKWQAQPGATEESCMVGDVNLFLTDLEDPTLGEIEVMIAEPSCRGKGLGTEAVLAMLSYGGDSPTDSE